jgi:hypothetical protein
MGLLIPIGLPNQGHSIDFEYIGDGFEEQCFMVCECGWKIEIESYQNAWSLIETRVRLQRHMEEIGLVNNE